MTIRWLALITPILLVPVASGANTADARRGAEFFTQQKCDQCHGSTGAPDLTRRQSREYTPAGIAARMWNHAPRMWEAMQRSGLTRPSIDKSQAADLFAFYYSTRYFETRSDAGRGKKVFHDKGCEGCHSITGTGGPGTPVAKWTSLTDPVALVSAMWNHAATMKSAVEGKGKGWPELTSQQLSDLMLYLGNLPETRGRSGEFQLPLPGDAQALFDAKGCVGCHKTAESLQVRLRGRTLTQVAVELWNHAPKMRESAKDLSPTEMRQMMGFLWAGSFFRPEGNTVRGKRAFDSKNCNACHGDPSSGAPSLAGRAPGSAIEMVSVLWKHGPQMLEGMKQKNLQWPRLSTAEMTDLMAYLRSLGTGGSSTGL